MVERLVRLPVARGVRIDHQELGGVDAHPPNELGARDVGVAHARGGAREAFVFAWIAERWVCTGGDIVEGRSLCPVEVRRAGAAPVREGEIEALAMRDACWALAKRDREAELLGLALHQREAEPIDNAPHATPEAPC